MARKTACLAVTGLLLGLLPALGCDAPAADRAVLGQVDAERVFQSSRTAQAGAAFIGERRRALNARMLEMRGELAAKPEDEALEAALREEADKLENALEEQQGKAASAINDLFIKAAEECRKARKFSAVLPTQAMLASAPGSDLTDCVVQGMDKTPLDFAVYTAPAAQPAPVGAQPAQNAQPAPAPAPAGAE